MHLIYWDIDETLIYREGDFQSLTSEQRKSDQRYCPVDLYGKSCVLLHHLLHRAFFEEYAEKQPENVRLFFATDAIYHEMAIKYFFTQCFPTAASVFLNMGYISRYTFSECSIQTAFIQDALFSQGISLDDTLKALLPYNYYSKTQKIKEHSRLFKESFLVNTSDQSCDTYLIDNLLDTLIIGSKDEIYPVYSADDEYPDKLCELGSRLGLDVRGKWNDIASDLLIEMIS